VARPENKEVPEGRTVTMATIATNHIGRFIIEAAAAADARRQVEFYLLMSKHSRFKSPAGYMLKKLFYAWFHGLSKLQDLPCSAAPSVTSGIQAISVPKKVITIGGWNFTESVTDDEIPFGWIPPSQAFPTVDAVVCTDQHIITIQVTISPNHDTKLGGFEDLEKNIPEEFRRNRTWYHVFVTDVSNAESLQNQKPEGLAKKQTSVYSAILDISEAGLQKRLW
jgi:hypothetical protein